MKRRRPEYYIVFHTCSLCIAIALVIGNILAVALIPSGHWWVNGIAVCSSSWLVYASVRRIQAALHLSKSFSEFCLEKGAADFIAHLMECPSCRSKSLHGTTPTPHESLSLN